MFISIKRFVFFYCLLGVLSTASVAGIHAMYAVYLNQSRYTVRLTELSNKQKVTEMRTGGSFKTPKVLGKMNHQLELLDEKGAIFKTIKIEDPKQACHSKWNFANLLQPEYKAISLDKTDPGSFWNQSICLSGIIGDFSGLNVTIKNDGIVLEQGLDESILRP
ncbi:MAG: hypothetical protein ACRCYP_06575 [Alphaproteobacteria bacterium]